MPYYVRCFCRDTTVPTLNSVLAKMRSDGFDAQCEMDDADDLNSTEWTAAELIYKSGNGPIVVECNRDEGEDSLARQECDEFVEELAELDDSPERDRVMSHLRETKFVIASQLLSDIDDDGYNANGEFLGYFLKNCDGMIQADGEGFYDGDTLLVEM